MSIQPLKWNRPGLCGAACAQMVLHTKGVVGATRGEQEDVWKEIKNRTNGRSSASPEKECSGPDYEVFDKMIREACAGGGVLCWSTHPNALKATLRALLGNAVTVTVSKIQDEDTANEIIRGCLEDGGVPIVLINSATHWVVVDAWDANSVEAVRMLDPAGGAALEISLESWKADYMSVVDCGTLNHKYVIVKVGP